jgi:hypothetical protein
MIAYLKWWKNLYVNQDKSKHRIYTGRYEDLCM